MEFPEDLRYSKEHEWVLVEGNVATIGITDYAQDKMGDITFVELPNVGDKVSKDDAFGVIESVKTVSDVYAPVSGTVIEVNDDLPDNPELLNEDPYGDGWMIKVEMSDPEELEDLLSAQEYEQLVAEEKE
jgi:glycine cleavage system H protein